MSVVIPWVAQLSTTETTAWIKVFEVSLPGCTLLPIEQMTAAQLEAATVAVVANPDPVQLSALPNLKWVQSLWAGVERLLAETQGFEFSIVKMSDPQLAKTMAEAVLAWTLYLHHEMPRYRSQQMVKVWQQHSLPMPSQRTVGILGLGGLGKAAAQQLAGHGFTVLGWSRSAAELAGIETFSGPSGFEQMLQGSQILVCLLPLTSATQGLLDERALALLPVGASIINFARGPIVSTKALICSLDDGHLAHAVLDVFDEEPLPGESPLWEHPGVTVLPHIAAQTNKQTASAIAAKNIQRFLTHGEIPRDIVKSGV